MLRLLPPLLLLRPLLLRNLFCDPEAGSPDEEWDCDEGDEEEEAEEEEEVDEDADGATAVKSACKQNAQVSAVAAGARAAAEVTEDPLGLARSCRN